MKKALTLLICTMLSISILTGCGGTSPIPISTYDEISAFLKNIGYIK